MIDLFLAVPRSGIHQKRIPREHTRGMTTRMPLDIDLVGTQNLHVSVLVSLNNRTVLTTHVTIDPDDQGWIESRNGSVALFVQMHKIRFVLIRWRATRYLRWQFNSPLREAQEQDEMEFQELVDRVTNAIEDEIQ